MKRSPSALSNNILTACAAAMMALVLSSRDAVAQTAAPACNATAVNAVPQVNQWRTFQQIDALRFCPTMGPADLAHYTALRAAVDAALAANHCAMTDVGLTDITAVAQIPCAAFDLESLPPGAALDLIDRLGGAIPTAIDGLSITPGLKAAMNGFPGFALKGVAPLTDLPTDRDAAWATYYAWLREMGYTPSLPAAAAGAPAPAVTPDTEWTCPAPAAPPTAACQGYYDAALATVQPIVARVNSGATAADATKAQEFLDMATATTTTGTTTTGTTFDSPLHRRLMYVAAAWQNVPPKYQAHYRAEVEGRERFTYANDPATLAPLTGQSVTVFHWGQEAVEGTVASADATNLTVTVAGASQTFPVTDLTATPPGVVVFVNWPPAWKEARDAVSSHGRSRLVNPTDPTAGLPAFIGHEIEAVAADGAVTTGVLKEAAISGPNPTFTLQGNSAPTPFDPNTMVFFAGVKESATRTPTLTVGPVVGFVAGRGTHQVTGGYAGAEAVYQPGTPFGAEARVGIMGLDTAGRRAHDYRGDPKGVYSPLATVGARVQTDLPGGFVGARLAGGTAGRGAALDAGIYGEIATPAGNIEAGLSYLLILGGRARAEKLLGRSPGDALSAHLLSLQLGLRF